MTELKPCPFCGGEAMVKSDRRWPDGCGDSPVEAYEVVCQNMDCVIYGADSAYYLTEAEAIAAWNTRAAHGTLTAEQVMAIAGKHQPDYCSDTHACFDWQAIADELNAAMGGGKAVKR